jgi:dsRNA-specific ribonuclease
MVSLFKEESFKNFIGKILTEEGGISLKNKEEILDYDGMNYYSLAFTSPSVDSVNNYQFLETLGDSTLNKAIIWYFSRRFPQINSRDGIDILTKLKIKFTQKKSFAFLAQKMGFQNFIAVLPGEDMISTLEDVFEAFFGATELVLDKKYKIGSGYRICYKIICKLLDTLQISIGYEELVDAITRFKELFDQNKHKGIGKFEYIKVDLDICKHNKVCRSAIRHFPENGPVDIIGTGEAQTIEEAEQIAASNALEYLKNKGFIKTIPDEYLKYCT